MTYDKIYAVLLSAAAGLLVLVGWKATARAAYESAEYAVIESDGEFEIREYPNLMLATTSMRFARQGNDGSFMRLFRYISGSNESKQKIAMTTPVFMQPDTETEDGQMAFVMPKQAAAEGTPEPASDQVKLRQRPGGRFAVIRFSGRLNSESFERAEQKLREWMGKRGLTAASAAESAGYDPPWIPGPLRRNEVLIRLSTETEQTAAQSR